MKHLKRKQSVLHSHGQTTPSQEQETPLLFTSSNKKSNENMNKIRKYLNIERSETVREEKDQDNENMRRSLSLLKSKQSSSTTRV